MDEKNFLHHINHHYISYHLIYNLPCCAFPLRSYNSVCGHGLIFFCSFANYNTSVKQIKHGSYYVAIALNGHNKRAQSLPVLQSFHYRSLLYQTSPLANFKNISAVSAHKQQCTDYCNFLKYFVSMVAFFKLS